MSGYDRGGPIFSPDGHLLQVEYAQRAAFQGSTAIGVRGENCIVLGVERRMPELQIESTVRRMTSIDEHVVLAFSGVTPDARILIQSAQWECQHYKLVVEDSVKLEYITRFIAELKNQYTLSIGMRPFGVSCIIGGFDADGTPHLFQTEPSGTYDEWMANATGRYSREALKVLEEHYNDELVATDRGAIKLAIMALLTVAEEGKNNLEISILEKGRDFRVLDAKEIEEYVVIIEKEKEEDAKKKKSERPSTSA